jgi:hypothetical protein
VLGLVFRFSAALAAPALIYTAAPRFDFRAAERFPSGARLHISAAGVDHELVPAFAASADAAVSFDGTRVLFSGKQKSADAWQIWEMPLAEGAPRRVTFGSEDCVRPFYLPDDLVVYSRRTPRGFQLETVPLAGGTPRRLTYAPGNHFATDVLADGRILFDAPQASGAREVFAVYTDGSGVEAYRCDHGPDRSAGRELANGDIIFETAGLLARFTSARATKIALPATAGEFAGPIEELSPKEWLASYRPTPRSRFGLYRYTPGSAPVRFLRPPKGNAVEPVLARPRPVPPIHPSGLGNRNGANLLCLNVYTSRAHIPTGSVAAFRVYTQNEKGAPVLLGTSPVERDGSFFVRVPADAPLRFELLDAVGKIVQAEKEWFWARRGEQRVCVGCHAGPERAPDNVTPKALVHSTVPVDMLPHGGAQ